MGVVLQSRAIVHVAPLSVVDQNLYEYGAVPPLPAAVNVIAVLGGCGAVRSADNVTFGAAPTVNATPLLACVPTVTVTGPGDAVQGTIAVMLVWLHEVTVVAVVPLNLTTLVPFVAPKFAPVIVTLVPTGPEVGLSDEIAGEPPDPVIVYGTLTQKSHASA